MKRVVYILTLIVMFAAVGMAAPQRRVVEQGRDASLNYVAQLSLNFATDDFGYLWDSVPMSVTYFDGLGRKIQSATGVSGNGSFVADYIEYDARGRVCRQWLAAASSGENGAFAPLSALKTQYEQPAYAFASMEYEQRVASRPSQTRAPGEAWHNAPHGQTAAYAFNTTSGDYACRNLLISGGRITKQGMMPANTLSVESMVNEDNERVITFKDPRGLVRLIRTISMQGVTKETYFLYDSLDRLVLVIPPGANTILGSKNYALSDKEVTDICYLYDYDPQGRVFSKSIPGAGRYFSIYTRGGKPAFAADALLLQQGKSMWFLYDGLGRQVCSGIGSDSDASRFASADYVPPVAQTRFDADSGTLWGYLPVSGIENRKDLLTVDYYDDYRFLSLLDPAQADSLAYKPIQGCDGVPSSYQPKGRLTGSMRKIVGKDGLRQYIISAFYYDSKGRVVQTRTLNHLGSLDVTAEALSFDGRPLYSVAMHGSPEGNVTTERDYAYTAEGLLRELKMRVDGGDWVSLASNRYDDLRRLQDARMIDSQVFVGYGYTPEGKLRSVESEAFSQTLYREKRPNGATGYLAGDISALEFRLASTDLEVETRQGEGLHGLYDYIYDGGMLKSATYTELSRTSPIPTASNVGTPVHRQPDYSVAYSYDARGNAISIKRRGVTQTSMEQVKGADGVSRFTEFFDYGLVDDLTLSYEGNRLTKVYDAAEDPDFVGANDFVDGADEDTEYEYDVLGRLTKDKNKGITSIAYNEIGLPSDVFIAGAHIRYTYAAGGELLCKAYGTDVMKFLTGSPWSPGIPYVVFEADSRRDYAGAAEYQSGTLERLNHEAGWWNADGRHTAAIRDWQGSLRATWTEGDYTQTLAPPSTLFPGLTRRPRLYKNLTAYYPYGLPFADRQGTDRYLYSSKELDRTHGLQLYDFHARTHDPQLARFLTPDPCAERYFPTSPYAYCAANPIAHTDPTGKTVQCDNTLQGRLMYTFSREEQEYIKFNKYDQIDPVVVNSHTGDTSEAFRELSIMVNSERNYIAKVSDSYVTNGEEKRFDKEKVGVTLIPGAKDEPSPDDNVYIYVKQDYPAKEQMETLVHELFGHGYFYELQCTGEDVNPFHTIKSKDATYEWNEEYQTWEIIMEGTKSNTFLEEQIKKAVLRANQMYNINSEK